MKTLITSFGPFGAFQSNPSNELMLMLKEDGEFNRQFDVEYHALEVSYQAVDEWVDTVGDAFDLIIHMGVASGAELLRLEKLARNTVQGEDVRGFQPSSNKIDADGRDIPTNLPEEVFDKILAAFEGVSMISEDAGSYLCNYLFYKSLSHLSSKARVLFVHVADVQQLPEAVDLKTQKVLVKGIIELTLESF